MKQYYLLSTGIFIILLSACGKTPSSPATKDTAKKKIIQSTADQIQANSTAKPDIVDADEFSKAFSKAVYRSEEKSVEQPVDNGDKFFQSGEFVQNKFSNQDFKENSLPPASLAATLKTPQNYSWLPHWDFSGKGGVRIPDAAISTDKSLIAILDNVSSHKGQSSTLIVLINTYNFNINAIYYFQGHQFTKVKFVSSQPELVVWEQNQQGEKSGVLHLIDLKKGKIAGSSGIINALSANFALSNDGKTIILKPLAGKQKLYLFSVDALSQTPLSLKCDQKDGIITVSKNSEFFSLIGEKEIEIFKFSDKRKLKNIQINLQAVPDDAICIDNNKFAMLSYNSPLLVVINEDPKKICDLAGRRLFFRDDNQTIVFEEYKNRAISIADLKRLELIDSFSPEKLKPTTKGGALLLSYLPQIERYMVLDNQGNLSLFYRPGRRWRKEVIFSAEK